MDVTVNQEVSACMPCARTKAGLRVSGKELQPLHLQGIMFQWGIDIAGPLPTTVWGFPHTYVLMCIKNTTKSIE